MKFLNPAAWGRHRAAVHALLAVFRVNTLQSAFVTLAPWIFSAVAIWLFPADAWGKMTAGLIAWIVVIAIVYLWVFLTIPEQPNPVFGLSPLYSAEGRKKFRAEQLAVKEQIEQLSSNSARLAAHMAKLDLTTSHGQDQLRQLSGRKAEIDSKLAGLKSSIREIGFTLD